MDVVTPPSSVSVEVPSDAAPPSVGSVNASRPVPPLLVHAPADPPPIATPGLGELGPNDPFFDQARLALVTLSHVPQVIAVGVITPRLWSVDFNDGRCNRELSWVLIQAVFLVLSLVNYWLWFWLVYWSERPPLLISAARRERGISLVAKTHAALYIFGLVWFMVGNALLLVIDVDSKACGADSQTSTSQADTTGIHDVGLALLAMAYARVLWPCTLVLLGLPFLLLCRPCVLRYLSDPARDGLGFAGGGVSYNGSSHGATKRVIEASTDTVQFEMGMEIGAVVCCICLIDYDEGDKLRVLPCKHEFHLECVDEWLTRNATCPTCRKGIESNGARLDAAVQDVNAIV